MKISNFRFSFIIFFLTFLFLSIISFYRIRSLPLSALGGLDIRAFYTGGRMLSNGIKSDFYSFSTQYDWQKDIFSLTDKKYLMPFVFPSFVAIPFSFLSSFPVSFTYKIITLVNILLAVISFFVLMYEFKIFSSPLFTLFICLLILIYAPLWEALRQGQLSLLLLFSFVSSWYVLKRHKYLEGGVLLSLLFMRPNLLFVPFLVFIWKREWKILSGIIIGTVVLLLISVGVTGAFSMYKYFTLLFSLPSLGNSYTIHPQLEPTIRGFLQSLYHSDSFIKVLPIYLLLSTGFFVSLIYSWRGKINPQKDLFNIQWAALIFVTVLTSPHTNPHDLVLLVFPLMLLLCIFTYGYFQKPQGRTYIVSLVILIFTCGAGLFIFYPLILFPLLLAIALLVICRAIGRQPDLPVQA